MNPFSPPPTKTSRVNGTLALTAILLAPLLAAAGCARGTVAYTLDSSFSVNIADVNPEWPTDLAQLPAHEQEAYEEHGRPDYIHIFWSKRKDIVFPSDVDRIIRESKKRKREFPQGWIYLDKKEEVVFPGRPEDPPEVQPLSDKLEVICEMGDPIPSYIRNFPSSTGKRTETWHYVGEGVIYTFVDEIMVKKDTTSVPPVRSFLR